MLANIPAGTLVELAPVLTAATVPGGHLTLSGLLEGQMEEVAGAYGRAFALHAGGACDGWARLDGTRRPGRRSALLGRVLPDPCLIASRSEWLPSSSMTISPEAGPPAIAGLCSSGSMW